MTIALVLVLSGTANLAPRPTVGCCHNGKLNGTILEALSIYPESFMQQFSRNVAMMTNIATKSTETRPRPGEINK